MQKKFKGKYLILIIAVVLIVVVFFLSRQVIYPSKSNFKTFHFYQKTFKLPERFVSAQSKASLIGQEIVEITSQTNQYIKKINILDLSGDYSEALNLIKIAREKNKQVYDLAFELSTALQEMTQSLSQFKSLEKRKIAQSAISLELALISEFLNYTRLLNDFFSHLSIAISTNDFNSRHQLEKDLTKINGKIKVINSLNQQFNQQIKKL